MNRLEWATLMDFADLPGHADFPWMKALKMNNAAAWTIKKERSTSTMQSAATFSERNVLDREPRAVKSFLFNPRVGQNIAFNASPVARNYISVLSSTLPWLICCWHAYFKTPSALKKICKICAEIIKREILFSSPSPQKTTTS